MAVRLAHALLSGQIARGERMRLGRQGNAFASTTHFLRRGFVIDDVRFKRP